MQPKSISTRFRAVAVGFVGVLFLTSAWATDHETVLYNFDHNAGADSTTLIRDAAGDLFGLTSNGGIYQCGVFGCGTVFELSPLPGGGWTETVLHNFGNGTDGSHPTGLMMDAARNLYGLTRVGGLNGGGIAYELSPSEGGGWTETVLYNFTTGGGYGNGTYNLVKDATGNLYGTMFGGGAYGEGIIFELSSGGSGAWTETVLHNFGSGTDGADPLSGVIMDAAGNLYGTTSQGGTDCNYPGCGVIYELSPNVDGSWIETVLHNFDGSDGDQPWAVLITDAAGNLYGTTSGGGRNNDGIVFELSPGQGGGWIESVLHSFSFDEDGRDGWGPVAALIQDAAGNLYGTTYAGGINDVGTVFELSPLRGSWREAVLHNFGDGDGGTLLFGGVVMDRAGDLYGTTAFGGCCGAGTVFELTPSAVRPSSNGHQDLVVCCRVPKCPARFQGMCFAGGLLTCWGGAAQLQARPSLAAVLHNWCNIA